MHVLRYRECNITRWHKRYYLFKFMALIHVSILKYRNWDYIILDDKDMWREG